jgi:hypothetical protein
MIAFDGGHFAFRNKLINGDMDIWQRGTTFTVSTSSAYTADRWAVYTDILRPGRGNVTQSSDVPSNSEFQTSLQFQVTTVSNANNQPLTFRQIIEGYNARDLIAQTFNISFWVKSSKTGTYSVCLGNAGNGVVSDRSYVTEYTINTNNWEKKTIVVPGGLITAGTWNWTNGRGLEVIFGMAGAGASTPLNAWVTGDIETSPNQVNLLDVVGNAFNITGVQLERGVAATPFEHRPFGTELALCQRYYEVTAVRTGAYQAAGQHLRTTFYFQPKRLQPSFTLTVTETSNAGSPIVDSAFFNSARYLHTALTAANSYTTSTIIIEAEL